MNRKVADLEADFSDVDCHCDLPLGAGDEAYGGETARDRVMGIDVVFEVVSATHGYLIDALADGDREICQRIGTGDVICD